MKTLIALISILVMYSQSMAQSCNSWFVSHPQSNGLMAFTSQVSMSGFFWGQDYSIVYSWDFGDGEVSTESNPLHQYNAVGPYTVCLSIEIWLDGAIECSDSDCSTIEVYSLDTTCEALFELELDENGLLTTTNLSSNNLGEAEYVWYLEPGHPISSQFEPNHQYNTSGGFEVCLHTTSYEGSIEVCHSQSCQLIQVELPPVNCPAGQYPLQVQINTISEATAYFGDDVYISINTPDYSENILTDGFGMNGPPSVYTTNYCIPDGCYVVQLDYGINDTNYLGTLFMSSPNLSFIDSTNVFGCCAYNYELCLEADESACASSISASYSEDVCFDFVLEGWQNADSVLWNFGGEDWIVGNYIQSYCFLELDELDTQEVTAIGYGAFCEEGSTSSIIIEIPVIQSTSENYNSTVSIYPNPSENFIRIDLAKNANIKNFRIANATGQVVISGPLHAEINVSTLPAGVYYLSLIGEGVLVNRKIIKQ
ncbi:MAG: PKD domain-containing protein [Flavobacteriales bacterium]